ncbi:hypothetical protein [Equine parapoxvirus]|nr:hypothetical protein [Equine parapoxvirus]WOC29301.1 hypothetical protein [Equine parapoxvirus]WOC29310.1 hypothetical protein [Equine parapoxvirus]
MSSHLRKLVEAAVRAGDAQRAFAGMPAAQAMALVAEGLHPRHLPRRLYAAAVKSRPASLHLFRPQHVLPEDLLEELARRRCAALLAEHVAYYTSYVAEFADLALLRRCVPYMDITEDDVRLIEDRFPDELDDLLLEVNARSVLNINAAFTDEMIEAIAERRPAVAEALYATRPLDLEFLKRMLREHGVAPANAGMEAATPPDAVEVLAQLESERDVRRTLEHLRHSVLASETVKTFVLDRVRRGQQLRHYAHYAREHLQDRVQDMGPFGPVFVAAACYLNLDELTREQMLALADFPGKYDADHMAALARARGFDDVLGKLLRSISVDAVTEEVCVAALRAGARVPVNDMCVHTPAVARACAECGAEDAVDLLDTVPLSELLRAGVDPFLTDYAMGTFWFNARPELAVEYLARFAHCGPRMSRLLFGYPLKPCVLRRMLDALEAGDPARSAVRGSLAYLVSRGEMRLRAMAETRRPRESDELEEGYEQEVFSSAHSARLAVCLRAYSVPGLRGYATADLAMTRHPSGSVVLQSLRAYRSESAANKVFDHAFDVARMASYGLFLLPDMFTPEWTPVLALARGERLAPPPVLVLERLSFSPSEMVEYAGIGLFSLRYDAPAGPCSDHQTAMDALFRCLFVHLAVGVRLTESMPVAEFARRVLDAFADGLCVARFADSLADAELELAELRAWGGPGVRRVLASQVPMARLAALCERVCAHVALYNNQAFKK